MSSNLLIFCSFKNQILGSDGYFKICFVFVLSDRATCQFCVLWNYCCFVVLQSAQCQQVQFQIPGINSISCANFWKTITRLTRVGTCISFIRNFVFRSFTIYFRNGNSKFSWGGGAGLYLCFMGTGREWEGFGVLAVSDRGVYCW